MQLSCMRYNFIDAALGLALVCTLIPRWGVRGYIVTMFAARTVNALLSLRRLIGTGRVPFDLWVCLGQPGLCAAAA